MEFLIPSRWINSRSLLPQNELYTIYKFLIEYFEKTQSKKRPVKEIIEHMSSFDDEFIIPEDVAECYKKVGRPTPLFRASSLEKYFQSKCKVFLKREDLLSSGCFKINSIIPQISFAKLNGYKEVVGQTAGGTNGIALALGSRLYNMGCTIFMPRLSYNEKIVKRKLIKLYEAKLIPSPSDLTQTGRKFKHNKLDDEIASSAYSVSESYEYANLLPEAITLAGSFVDHTLTYNSVIGQEALNQLNKINIKKPDCICGCIGGGSGFGGLIVPFLKQFKDTVEYWVAEEKSIPKITAGTYDYHYSEANKVFPKIKMYSLGHDYQVPKIKAHGLRYSAVSPIISSFIHKGMIKAKVYTEEQAIKAGQLFSKIEGVIPSIETAYTIAYITDYIKEYANEERVVLAMITGSGLYDLDAYIKGD